MYRTLHLLAEFQVIDNVLILLSAHDGLKLESFAEIIDYFDIKLKISKRSELAKM